MNPNFYYFYEYRNNRKLRNVGFLNLIHRKGTYFLKLSVKQISVSPGTSVPLFALYQTENSLFSKKIEMLTCGNQMLTAQLELPDTLSPVHNSQAHPIGFYVYLPNKRLIAAVAPGITPNFEHISELPDKLISPPETKALTVPTPDSPAQETSPSTPSEPETTDILIPDTGVSEPPATNANSATSENLMPNIDSVSSETIMPGNISVKSSSSPADNFAVAECPANRKVSSTSADTVTVLPSNTEIDISGDMKKITTSDLVFLPRRHWNLANNSFLLHGYHNYGHLLLIKEEQHYWLGIPGIYHPREARAAEHFGFPQFTRSCHQHLKLSDNECSKHPDFGYWCRYIR